MPVHGLALARLGGRWNSSPLVRAGKRNEANTIRCPADSKGMVMRRLNEHYAEEVVTLEMTDEQSSQYRVMAKKLYDLAIKTRTDCEPYLDEAAAKGLSLSLDLPASPVPVRIDLQAFHLILSNLVSNAIKYTPTGSVQVQLRKEEPWAVLKVKDTGMGIPAAVFIVTSAVGVLGAEIEYPQLSSCQPVSPFER